MSCLWYNIIVINMKKEYDYYIKMVKPIEKRKNRICFLYSIFKFKFLKEKKSFYNRLLINYYKMVQNDVNYFKNLEKEINK